jgi:hypothetical protein
MLDIIREPTFATFASKCAEPRSHPMQYQGSETKQDTLSGMVTAESNKSMTTSRSAESSYRGRFITCAVRRDIHGHLPGPKF